MGTKAIGVTLVSGYPVEGTLPVRYLNPAKCGPGKHYFNKHHGKNDDQEREFGDKRQRPRREGRRQKRVKSEVKTADEIQNIAANQKDISSVAKTGNVETMKAGK